LRTKILLLITVMVLAVGAGMVLPLAVPAQSSSPIYSLNLTIPAHVIVDIPGGGGGGGGGGGVGGGGGGVGALEITDIEVANITETSAKITFRTNRGATTRLTYSASPEIVIKDSDFSKGHTVILEGLDACTEYQFVIKCVDRYGLRDTEDGEFITLCIEPIPTPTPPPEPEPTPPPTTPPITTPPATITTPPETVPEPGTYWWPLLWAGIGLAVIALGVLVWWWFKIKKKPKQPNLDKK
jgi:hypothetical protein